MNEIEITQPSPEEFEMTCQHAGSFNPDRDDLHPGQFIIARYNVGWQAS